jgi:ribosomal protein S18 acetylase RimI-like enzyme
MPLEVRPAEHADIEALQRIAEEAWHAAHAPIVGAATVEAFLAEFYDADSFRDRIEAPDRHLLVAADDAPVGFACAVASDGETFDLGMCYVAPARWGEGIGGRLLDHIEDRVVARGGSRIELGVMAGNVRARGFYEAAELDRPEG